MIPSAISAGVAYIDILPRFGAFVAATQSGLARVTKSMEKAGKTMTKFVTLPIVGMGAAAVKLAADFELSMSRIRGLVGLSAKEVATLGEEILALAPAVGKGPKELADALYFVVSSGIDAAKAMEVVRVSARAATAGLGDTRIVADAVTSAINAYRNSGLTAAQATDVLTATVREGKGEASELATVIGRVIPVAAEVGVEFHEVGAAIAGMTLTGLDADEAVTALRQIFTLLLKPAKQSREALSQIGLTADDVAAITGRLNLSLTKGGLSIQKLRDIVAKQGLLEGLTALKGAIGEDRDVLGAIIPNVRALTGFLSLTGENAAQNAQIFRELADSTGSADAAFAAAAETSRVKFDKALAALQVSGIRTGNVLLPVLSDFVEKIGDLIKRFSDLSPATKKTVLQFAAAAAVIGPLLRIMAVFGKLIKNMVGLTSAVVRFFVGMITGTKGATLAQKQLTLAQKIGIVVGRALRATMAFIFSPTGLIIVGIVAIIALVYVFRKQIFGALKAIGRFFMQTFGSIGKFFASVWKGILDFWRDTVATFRGIWESFVRGLQRIWATIGGPVKATMKVISKIIEIGIKFWATVFKVQFKIIAAVVKTAFAAIREVITVAFKIIKPFIEFGLNLILFVFKSVWALITGIVRTAWELIKLIVRTAVNLLRPIVEPVLRALATAINAIWGAIKAAADAVWSAITAVIKFYVNVYKTVVVTAFNAVKDAAIAIWNALKTAAGVIWDAIRVVIVNPAKAAFKFIGDALGTLKRTWESVWGTFKGIVSNVWDGIKNVIRTGVNGIIRFINIVISGLNKMVDAADKALGPFINFPKIPKINLIPELDTGGTILETGIAVVHKGETVVPEGMAAAGGNVYVTVEGSVTTEQNLVRVIREALLATRRRNASVGLT